MSVSRYTSPSPASPNALLPQQYGKPSCATAHVCVAPADTWVKRSDELTGVGSLTKTASEPLPSWPFELSPQHTSPPSVRTAQVCRAPPGTCVACRPPTTGGTPADRTAVPLPSRAGVPAPHQCTLRP